jgi:hypothetical protein
MVQWGTAFGFIRTQPILCLEYDSMIEINFLTGSAWSQTLQYNVLCGVSIGSVLYKLFFDDYMQEVKALNRHGNQVHTLPGQTNDFMR